MSGQATEDARRVAEHAARQSYGRLLAYVAARTRNIPAAEEALADAFRIALETWPGAGIPRNPEAWLLTVARRNAGHAARRRAVAAAARPTLELLADELAGKDSDVVPDERLKLMFICAHPAIDPLAHTPLMLQAVLGLDAARIASAFLVAPATMSQRLVRAKAKIRDAGIAFVEPDADTLTPRLDAVLQAIYAAYGSGWDDVSAADGRRRGLAEEAIWLARVVVRLMPGEAEAAGLLALMLYAEARTAARRGPDGRFVPLDRQDTDLWSRELIMEAESTLRAASAMGRAGRFQLEAAIQSVHCQRAIIGRTDWNALSVLYDGLAALAPAIGVFVSRAAARARTQGAMAGLALLDDLPKDLVGSYQPYWAVRAHLLAGAGRRSESVEAYRVAAGLTEDPAIRSFLMEASGDTDP